MAEQREVKKRDGKRREGEKKERWREWQLNPLPLLFLMIRLADPGEPLILIDVKCVISLLIKAETPNTAKERGREGGRGRERLTCLMGIARPLPMLSARASRPFLSLSVSLAFLDCRADET